MKTHIAMIVLMISAAAGARELKYPLKTKRTLWTDQEIATARENVRKYPTAKKVADDIIHAADYWTAWTDEDLVKLVTASNVPRAFETGTGGCPKCGHEIYQKFTQYGWLVDPKVPFKVKCPVDGTVYPNDQTPDDGWGWKNPKDGEKYWFVAYWNHWMWHKHLAPGVRNLGRAYLLTGDKKYAHKAAVLLHRIAEVYPAMDHAKQSRYGQMMAARGADYPGKVVNNIWECGLAENLTEAYDDVWETIDADSTAQRLFTKTGKDIRTFIEANFLEDAIDAVFTGKIRGNFGMHQNTLVYLGIVRQFGETEKWFDELLNRSSPEYSTLGLNYALYNLVSRDGFPMENAPGYNFIWVSKIAEYGDLLARMGKDVFTIPRTKRLFDAVIHQVVVGKKTPAIGDSSSVWGGMVGQTADVYQTAYRHYGDERYARWLQRMEAVGEKSFTGFESLLYPPTSAKSGDTTVPTATLATSRLFDGYGQAVLNDPSDRTGLSMFYGLHAGHGHFDRLNIDIFAQGEALTPDLGYPDAMNDFVKGIYSWSKNTISHNTVTVDAQRQTGNRPGEVKLFAAGSFARIIDVDARGTYPQCKQYRRAVVMVDCAPGQSYFVDFFTVEGGKQHDYSLHGPPGNFEMVGGKWSEPQTKGTLAGEDVEPGSLYDRPEMAAPGYSGGFATYTGSGFQHLFNVRRLTSARETWAAQWTHAQNGKAHVRIRVLDQPDQEGMVCDARVSPVKDPSILKYLIARKKGEGVKSRFISIVEPYGDKRFIRSAVEQNGTIIIEREGGERDVIEYDGANTRLTVTTSKRRLSIDGFKQTTVQAVDPARSVVRIKSADLDPAQITGRIVHFNNKLHRTAHPIASAKQIGDEIELALKDDLIVGRARIEGIEQPDALSTTTAMPFAVTYRGTWICTSDFRSFLKVKSVTRGKIQLTEPLPQGHPFKPGEDVWLVDAAPGDEAEVVNILENETP